MTRTIITILIISVLSIYAGNVSITFSPFSFRLQRPIMAIGIFFFIMGLSLMLLSHYRAGKAEGLQKSINLIKEQNAAKEAGSDDTR